MSAPPKRRPPRLPVGPIATRTVLGGVLVTIPGVELFSEANERGHTLAKSGRTRTQRAAVGAVLRVMAGAPPPLPCRVVITRVSPLPLDTDNLGGAAKHVRDEVAVWVCPRVIRSGKKAGQVTGDDRDPRVEWLVAQETGPAAAVRIEVTPVTPWSLTAVSSRVGLEGPVTVAELTLDPARLERLAADLLALARGARSQPVTFLPARTLARLRFHLLTPASKETP